MTRPIRLARVLKRDSQLVSAIEQLCASTSTTLDVRNGDGESLRVFGQGNTTAQDPTAPIEVNDVNIGTVVGPHAEAAANLIATVSAHAQLNKAIGNEVLQLYRQQSATAALAELLSDTSEPDVVAKMVTDSVARAIANSHVAFLDDSGHILSSTDSETEFDRSLRPTEARIVNDIVMNRLAAPVVGADERFGHLQTVRTTDDFTAAEANLLGTFGVIAAAAMGRAVAHQRDLERARRRSQELEATVERLQSELDLVTTTVLASVLFTDLVDSTASQASVGDAGWARLIETHNRQATALVEEFDGTLVDFAGDGFFAWFETPSQAVECGRRHLELIEKLGLSSRAGVHVGEAQQRGSALSGLTVNAAARIMGCATAGQLLVSGVTADLLQSSEHRFEWAGDFTLKGIPAQQRLLSLVHRRVG